MLGRAGGCAGICRGLASGHRLGLGGGQRLGLAAVGGLLGALLGTLAYDLLGAAVFPMDKTSSPVAATAVARLVAHAATDLLAALGAGLLASSSGRSTPP